MLLLLDVFDTSCSSDAVAETDIQTHPQAPSDRQLAHEGHRCLKEKQKARDAGEARIVTSYMIISAEDLLKSHFVKSYKKAVTPE